MDTFFPTCSSADITLPRPPAVSRCAFRCSGALSAGGVEVCADCLEVEGLGSRVGLGVGPGSRVLGLGSRLGSGVWGLGSGVWGLGKECGVWEGDRLTSGLPLQHLDIRFTLDTATCSPESLTLLVETKRGCVCAAALPHLLLPLC
eukprot:2102983-Rhodomonas_salina.1